MYNLYNLTFKDFTSEEAYLKLQNHFYCYDAGTHPEVDLLTKVIKNNFEISYLKGNPLTEDQFTVKRDFYNDFLLPKIIQLYSDYILFFQKEVEARTILEKDRIELFANKHLKTLYKVYVNININKADYLQSEIKQLLFSQLEMIKQYLSNNHILPNYDGLNKILIKANHIDILMLFHLLRKNSIVKNMYDNELGVLIDKNFKCLKKDKILKLNNSAKKLGEIKNGTRTFEKTLGRLQKLLMNEEFYKLD